MPLTGGSSFHSIKHQCSYL